ncbi:hypothetical protein BBW65_06520 [Helicobacter enhydrae]|uniref:Cytochrome C biogenesis protein transmembrane domain-containing protein n=1 Tax=Helicobacter enhydrae TaxID=222136 RepID=A0A1B1U6X1_9HELI|nr:cytochrome c biogenesis protein CcdA [Helicobacter enhydrae]ANV98471.1 hypothetical protein BBW65_06520 [Helicobacter enhydrae]
MDERFLFSLFANFPFVASFLAGILTFLSPCILPLIPAYISYISGVSIESLRQKQEIATSKILFNCCLFLLGFSLVVVLMIVLFGSVFQSLFDHAITRYIVGGIICLFGLHFLGIFRINLLYKTKQINLQTNNSFWAPFVLGVSFAFGWTPCSGPILGSIFSLALTQKGLSIALICVYCLGLALPFVFLALFVGLGLKWIKKLTKHLRIIEMISGLLLILIGIAIATGSVSNPLFFLEG